MLRSFILGIAIASVIPSFGAVNPLSVFEDGISKKSSIVLDLSSMKAQIVSVLITDEAGEMVFTQNFPVSESGLKSFNLDQLAYGDYTFKLNDLTQVLKYKIRKDEKGVSVLDNRDITYKPTVWFHADNSADFHLLSLGKDVTVKLYDPNSQEVYSNVYRNADTISKRLQLPTNIKGKYVLEVRVEGETFFKYLNVGN